MRSLSPSVVLPHALLSVLLFAGGPVALAQEDDWCDTSDMGPAVPVPPGFQPDTVVTGTPIPVVFHIIYKRNQIGDEVGNVDSTRILDQIGMLNDEFAETGMSFSLLGIARIESERWHDNMSVLGYEMRPALNVDPRRVMNVYVGAAQDGLYGGSPGIANVGTEHDGIWLHHGYIGGIRGKNTVHETGHYMDLRHTWGRVDPKDASCAYDDGISDTARQDTVFRGCPMNPIPNTCVDTPIDYPDPISNHMNYTDDMCRTEFSLGQRTKMLSVRDNTRGELGEDVPTVIDERSAPVTYTSPTFDGNHIYVLPGADVTISGTVTLTNGARFVAVGGTDLGGIDGIALSGESRFEVRGYNDSLYVSGDITVSGGSTLRLGVRVEPLAGEVDDLLTGGPTFPAAPPLTVEGNVTVDSLGSTLVIGNGGALSLGANSVALFKNGGRYVTWGGTVLGDHAQFVFEQDAAIPELRAGFVEPTVSLGRDARLVFQNGDYMLDGSLILAQFHRLTIQSADPNEPWDRIAFEGDNLTLNRTTIEGGTTGALVRARGIAFDDVVLSGNETGIETDYTVCASPSCNLTQRSELALTDTRIEGSAFAGLYLRNADVAIETTSAEHNADYGLYVSNATLDPLTENVVTGSGFDENGSPIPGVIGDGIWVGANGDLYLGTPLSSRGAPSTFNRVADNLGDEIETAPGAYLFIGEDPNGDNAVFESGGIPAGTFLIKNVEESPVLAENTYWGDASGPPPGAFFKASLVDADPFLTTDPTGGSGAPFRNASQDELSILASATRTGTSATRTGTTAARGGEGDAAERFRERLRRLREQVMTDPAHPNARRLLRALYALQRLDRDDMLGEHAQTMALLGQLRSLLGEGAMPPPLRRAAEHALRAEVADALRAGDYDGTEALLGEYAPLVTDEATRQGLTLSAASLDEQRGRYAEAVAKLAGVVASLPPEAEELASALEREIAVIERRRAEADAEGGAGRPAGSTATKGEAARGTTAPTVFALGAAYPNPFDAATVVPFEIPEAAEVSVVVYDLLGREVARLAEGRREAGRYRVRFEAGGLAAGVYVVRAVMTAETGGAARAFSRKLTVMR